MTHVWVVEIKKEDGWAPFDTDSKWSRKDARECKEFWDNNEVVWGFRVRKYVGAE